MDDKLQESIRQLEAGSPEQAALAERRAIVEWLREYAKGIPTGNYQMRNAASWIERGAHLEANQ